MGSITRMSCLVSLLIGFAVTAHADVITDWNDKVVAAGVQTRQAPFVHTRVLPVGANWGQVTPFALKERAQFRPAAPVSLHSAQWAKDCDEVKKMGAKTGSGRTAEQTDIARLWELTGPGLHNQVTRQLAATKNLDILDNARLFALYAMAMADSYIAVFDAKYTYNFWRPVTAIRNADIDGNDATERDPA
jgi:hypothetical protein